MLDNLTQEELKKVEQFVTDMENTKNKVYQIYFFEDIPSGLNDIELIEYAFVSYTHLTLPTILRV